MIRKIKKLLVNVLAVIGAIAIGLGALVGVLAWATPVGNAIASVTSAKPEVNTTLIQDSFADMAELATESYSFTKVGKWSQPGTMVFGLQVPGTDAHYLITYTGEVKAGVKDASSIQIETDEDNHVVTVTVPAVEVLSSSIDPNSIETYDQSYNIVNQIEVSEVTAFLADQEKVAAEEAVTKGVLDRAQHRIEELIKTQVKAVLGEQASKYEVRVVLPPPPAP